MHRRTLVLGVLVLPPWACDSVPASRPPADDDAARGAAEAGAGGARGDGAVPVGDVGVDASPDAAPEGELRLNEAMPAPPEGQADWLELWVTGPGAVELGAYTLVDDDPDHAPVALPARTVMPGTFLRVDVTERPAAGQLAFPYGLGRDDALHLARDGERVDTLRWSGAQVGPERSVGRLPDGAGEVVSLTPTPGAANQALAAAGGLFDPARLLAVVLRFEPAAWEALPSQAVAATLTLGEHLADHPVRVARDETTPATWVVTFAPARTVDGFGAFELHCGDDPADALREVLGLETARLFGLPAPEAVLAEVRVQADPARLCVVRERFDAAFADRRGLGPGESLFRVRPPASDLRFLGREPAAYAGLETLEGGASSADFVDLVRALNTGDPSAYDAVLDRDTTLRFLALQAVMADLSGYGGAATHLAFVGDAGRLTPCTTGMPGAFGGPGCACSAAEVEAFPLGAPTCGPLEDRPLLARLLTAPAWREAYVAAVRAALDGPLAPAGVDARLLAWRAVAARGPVAPGFSTAFEMAVRARLTAVRAQILLGVPPVAPPGAACRAPAAVSPD